MSSWSIHLKLSIAKSTKAFKYWLGVLLIKVRIGHNIELIGKIWQFLTVLRVKIPREILKMHQGRVRLGVRTVFFTRGWSGPGTLSPGQWPCLQTATVQAVFKDWWPASLRTIQAHFQKDKVDPDVGGKMHEKKNNLLLSFSYLHFIFTMRILR